MEISDGTVRIVFVLVEKLAHRALIRTIKCHMIFHFIVRFGLPDQRNALIVGPVI